MASIGRVICYGHKPAPKGWRFKKYVGINRLYYIHSGTGGYCHEGRSYPFCADTLYFIPYSTDFTPFCREEDPIVHTYVDLELRPPLSSEQVLCARIRPHSLEEEALRLFVKGGERLADQPFRESDFFLDEAFRSLCCAAFLYLIDYVIKENGALAPRDKTIAEALATLHNRMGEPLQVAELARSCYLSEDAFIRRFARVVGTTPYAYLKRLRLRTALCLRESGMSLSQIAAEVGYADASSLLHALKREEAFLK